MATLTKPIRYDIQDTNIALLGSDLEKRVREEAGDKEKAWDRCGQTPGLEVWRIEKFHVVDWPKERLGSFYDGDSYIVLHTYKKDPESETLSYDLHFWLGENTSQDEAGTAAYKTVELDDHLQGLPVQYREVQSFESPRFLSYFPRFISLHGGVATGFHHVSTKPPLDLHRLYRVNLSGKNLVVHQVAAAASSLIEGDVYVLDKGNKILQFNTKASLGKEKFKAAEFVQMLTADRDGQCEVTVFDEGQSGAGVFLAEFGENVHTVDPRTKSQTNTQPTLFQLSDASGEVTFQSISAPTSDSLSSLDAFVLDDSSNSTHPTVYVWIGKEASLNERRLAMQYAQTYLYEKQKRGEDVEPAVSIVKFNEGREPASFLQALASRTI